MMWNSSVSSSVSFPRKDNGSEEHEAKTSEGPRREETKGSTGRHVACGDPTSVEEKDMKNRCSLELRTPQEGRDGFSSSANQEEIKEDEEKKHLLLAKRTIVSSRGVSPHQEGEDGDSRQERNPLPACSHVVNHQACERLQEEEKGLKEKESPTSPSFTCSTRCSLSLPLPPTSSPPPPPSLHLHSSCLSPRLTLLLSPPEGLPPSCPKKHTHECNPSSSADLLSSLLLSQRKENDCLAPLQSLEGGEEEGPLDGKNQEKEKEIFTKKGFQERKKVQEVGSSNEDEPYREALLTGGDSKVNCSEYSYPDIPKMSALKNRLCNPISDDLPLSSSPSISSSSLPYYYGNTQEDDSSEKRMFHGTPSSSSSFYKERHLSSSLHLSPLAERTTVVKS
ncbi:hypothetical protein CSUI_009895, partial [Cystoisospora suis]